MRRTVELTGIYTVALPMRMGAWSMAQEGKLVRDWKIIRAYEYLSSTGDIHSKIVQREW